MAIAIRSDWAFIHQSNQERVLSHRDPLLMAQCANATGPITSHCFFSGLFFYVFVVLFQLIWDFWWWFFCGGGWWLKKLLYLCGEN